MSDPRPTIRLDKWLWYARFFKTRGLASKHVSGGHVRVNGNHVSKPAVQIGAGDTLTFPKADRIRVVTLIEIGTRRGPAPEAQALYEDKSPPPPPRDMAAPRVGPRPTKKERRDAEKLRGTDLE